MTYLLDTDFLSAAAQRRPDPRALAWLARHDTEAAIPTVALAELRYGIPGAADAERRTFLDGFVAGIREDFADAILPATEEILIEWKALLQEIKRAGRPMGCEDSLIAATARAHQLIVVTANTRHFEAAGVRCLNPLVK